MIPPSPSTPCCEPPRHDHLVLRRLCLVAKGRGRKCQRSITRWLPRQIDIDKVFDQEIQDIVITANLTPRKCLGFKTPFQAILKELGKDVQIRFT